MVYVVYIVPFILYSWFLFKTGKEHAENKDRIKLVITGKPDQVKEALKIINEQETLK